MRAETFMKKLKHQGFFGFYRVTEDLIGYKKVYANQTNYKSYIAKLLIPKGSRVYIEHISGKMRASSVHVIGLKTLRGEDASGVTAISAYNPKFTYRVGQLKRPTEKFDDKRSMACSSGIHFYRRLADARRN